MKKRTKNGLLDIGLDMDGVLADYDGAVKSMIDAVTRNRHIFNPLDSQAVYNFHQLASTRVGFYRTLPVLGDAKKAVQTLHEAHHVVVCTAPKWINPRCWEEKQGWLGEHFPYLYADKRLILMPDKSHLNADMLVDDHPDWNGADKFDGMLVPFTGDWNDVFKAVEKLVAMFNT